MRNSAMPGFKVTPCVVTPSWRLTVIVMRVTSVYVWPRSRIVVHSAWLLHAELPSPLVHTESGLL
jgi:hypothetical protein